MSVSELDGARLREFAFAAADLLVSTDAGGRILSADGDAALLHHPSCDRLTSKNALDLISEGETGRLREDMWSLGPGHRIAWEDSAGIEGGRRIIVQRSAITPEMFTLAISRTPRCAPVSGDRAEEILAERFRDSVMNGRLRAAKQPVVDARTGAVSHFEILARFSGEESPVDLIAAAEKTGQISHLDYVMLHAACARLAAEPDPSFRLAVNISGESIQRPEVVSELCAVIAGHAFKRSRLIVEITESAQIRDLEAAARCVSTLRHCGVSVSLDDFGSGSASFGYLKHLDVDELKFDGGFLTNPHTNARGLALMRSVARMCSELGISSVGERVETESDRRLLIEAGVKFAQGYLFGKPDIDEAFFSRRPKHLRSAA